ncbi:hypothetical protein BANRA_05375 [Escherichia coli]|nr:hypothetical protein BANRA_05375 [Escherichia coli]
MEAGIIITYKGGHYEYIFIRAFGRIVVLLSPTNCSQDVSPIRLKSVQRNGKAAEVDAVVVQGSKRANNSSVADSDAVDSYFEMNPYSRENQANGWAMLARDDDQLK